MINHVRIQVKQNIYNSVNVRRVEKTRIELLRLFLEIYILCNFLGGEGAESSQWKIIGRVYCPSM